MNNGVVIIGAGHGGVQAAASLREEGFDGRIMLIGDEAELPYHKPPLSKTFIKDSAAKPQILRAEAFYSGASIDLAARRKRRKPRPGSQAAEARLGRQPRLRPRDPRHRLAPARAADRGRPACRRAVAALDRRRPRHPRTCRQGRGRRHPRRRLHRAGDRRDACRRRPARDRRRGAGPAARARRRAGDLRPCRGRGSPASASGC